MADTKHQTTVTVDAIHDVVTNSAAITTTNTPHNESIHASIPTASPITTTTTTTTTTTKPTSNISTLKSKFATTLRNHHSRLPYLHHIPLNALLIILLLLLLNLLAWLATVTIFLLPRTRNHHLLSTAALAYSLGLRHALDADHISAIDLMTRRLVAERRRPATVGTWFSLGHSTIVVVTCVVVAATAGGLAKKFDRFSSVGGIVGSSVSAGFLLVLGAANVWILWRLGLQLWRVVQMSKEQERTEGWKVQGSSGGVMFRVLKGLFRLIDRPWKMYPLGVLFGLGFDTSSEVALLGIASLQGANGTSIWLILVFPVLFTVGMCLLDTIDGALMMSLYVAPERAVERSGGTSVNVEIVDNEGTGDGDHTPPTTLLLDSTSSNAKHHHSPRGPSPTQTPPPISTPTPTPTSPLPFLYYSTILTFLTVLAALTIGTIQLLTLILNAAVSPDTLSRSLFWQGVERAGDNYDIIGGGICGAFIVVGGASVLGYVRFRAWVERVRQADEKMREEGAEGDGRPEGDVEGQVGGPCQIGLRSGLSSGRRGYDDGEGDQIMPAGISACHAVPEGSESKKLPPCTGTAVFSKDN